MTFAQTKILRCLQSKSTEEDIASLKRLTQEWPVGRVFMSLDFVKFATINWRTVPDFIVMIVDSVVFSVLGLSLLPLIHLDRAE